MYEPIQYSDYPRRRLSASDLQEVLCAQGHQLHIDPRYRDTRPIARSSSLVYVFEDVSPSPSRSRLDLCNPAIFIEEYNDDAEPVTVDYQADNQSIDSASAVFRRGSIVSQAHQPLNEDGIASVADSEEEIPFIDDEFDDDVEAYVPGHRSRAPKGGIMVKSASERRASSSGRKTVSFDLVENEPSKRNSISLDRENANFSRKSSTLDAISSYYIRESNDNYTPPITCLPKVQIFNEQDLELEVECPSPCHRQLNPERSTSPLMTKQRRRSMSNVPVPLRKFSSSSEVSMIHKNMKPPMKYTSYNSFNTPSIVIEGPATTVKQFGEGKVRELTDFFESQSFSSECFQPKFFSKSTPNLSAVNKLNEEEQCKVLRQLKEWGIHGTSGKDYILDFSHPSKPNTSQTHFYDHCTSKSPPYYCRSDSCLACSSIRCCCCRHHRRCDDFDCCPKAKIISNTLQHHVDCA